MTGKNIGHFYGNEHKHPTNHKIRDSQLFHSFSGRIFTDLRSSYNTFQKGHGPKIQFKLFLGNQRTLFADVSINSKYWSIYRNEFKSGTKVEFITFIFKKKSAKSWWRQHFLGKNENCWFLLMSAIFQFLFWNRRIFMDLTFVPNFNSFGKIFQELLTV